jgi:hypothetical protein
MLSTAAFAVYCQWFAIGTVVCAVLTVLAFLLKWAFKFRLVGVTGFMGVLTAGLFALSLVPLVHAKIPGALQYSSIYDNGNDIAVIRVQTPITETALDATLRQAAVDLFSYGRSGGSDGTLSIRARTNIHPQKGISQPVFLGEAIRNLRSIDPQAVEINIDRSSLSKVNS